MPQSQLHTYPTPYPFQTSQSNQSINQTTNQSNQSNQINQSTFRPKQTKYKPTVSQAALKSLFRFTPFLYHHPTYTSHPIKPPFRAFTFLLGACESYIPIYTERERERERALVASFLRLYTTQTGVVRT